MSKVDWLERILAFIQAPALRRASLKSTTCSQCKEPGLRWTWDYDQKKATLIKLYTAGLAVYPARHICCAPAKKRKCKYCPIENLTWGKKIDGRFVLIDSSGSPHECPEFKVNVLAFREALRENYAWEKKYMQARLGKDCKKCKTIGWRGKTNKNTGYVKLRRCKTCRGVGKFTKEKVSWYLKCLRLKYWPPPAMWKHG